MKKGNIIDLRTYRKRRQEDKPTNKGAISKELQLALKRLIQRMRKPGPMRGIK